jgi:hypothetical protein
MFGDPGYTPAENAHWDSSEGKGEQFAVKRGLVRQGRIGGVVMPGWTSKTARCSVGINLCGFSRSDKNVV